MKTLEALRYRRFSGSGRGTQANTSSRDERQPIPGYDGLTEKEITEQLSQLSQVELTEVEAYERAHDARLVVLDKLRYMRGSEPLPGYDALTPEQIAEALAGADAGTVRAVRDYERKFGGRREVMDEAARVLPSSQASAGEERAHQEKVALLREGYADRERMAPEPAE